MQDKIKKEVSSILLSLKQGILQVFTANVINKIIVMISNMVITRILTKSSFGLWSYVLNIYSYASLCTGLGLASGALQFGSENRGNLKRFEYYKYCLSFGLIVNAFISIIFIMGSFLFKFHIDGSSVYIRYYVPILLVEYTIDILLIVLRCEGRMIEYARILNVNTILIAVLTCLGAFFNITGVIIGKYLAVLFSVIHIVRITKKEIKSIISSAWITANPKKEIWHYSIFTGLSSILNRVLYLIDVSMIASLMMCASDVAVYKVATMIPNSLYFIPSSIIVVILPTIVAHNNDRVWLRNKIKKLYFGISLLNLGVTIFLIIFARFIIVLISGTQYSDSVYPFRVLVLGYMISGTFRDLSVNILAGLRKVSFNLVISVITGISDIVLNLILIKRYGMIGAAYATFIVEILASVISFSFVIWVIKKDRMVKRNDKEVV